MTASLIQMIEADCSVLLLRSLMNKTVYAFGEDGLGKYGTSDRAHTFLIDDLEVDIIIGEDGVPYGAVFIHLDGYNSSAVGHIATDKNFMICIQKILQAEHIDPASLSYAPIELQGGTFVTMEIDIDLLLDWA